MTFEYTSDSGYTFLVYKNKFTKRIKNNKENDKEKENKNSPHIGDYVEIIIKPYKNFVKVKGVVLKLLTKKKFHSRGHKVLLEDGTIGRICKIIKCVKK